MSDAITTDEKIAFLKHLFPKPMGNEIRRPAHERRNYDRQQEVGG